MAQNINIVITATDKASKPLREAGKGVEGLGGAANRSSLFMAALGRASTLALTAGAAGFAAMTAGAVAASKASFDQVRGVENARFGLQAYERDADKVNEVLGGLVAYAKSDMGVLFNRRDLFDAASTLKMYGDATDDITGHVKILSKGVAQGKTTFQELSSIIGRTASKGRLDAVDFDMLIERGIGIDKKFRGAKLSSEELWKALNNAIPDSTLAGRADTIDGKMVRLQTAFRNVGDAILGVDSKTSNFTKNGLGDRFMNAVSGATSLLKYFAPYVGQVTNFFLGLIDSSREVADQIGNYLNPKFENLWSTVSEKLWPSLEKLWHQVLEPLVPVLGSALVGAFGAVIDIVNVALTVLSPFISFLADNQWVIWGIVGALAAVKTALFIQAQVSAFQAAFGTAMVATQANIATTGGVFATFKALITTPLVMPAVAVGAAIAALVLVQQAADRAKDAIEGARKQADMAHEEDMRSIRNITAQYQRGEISKETRDKMLKIVGANASGTNAWMGGPSLVGEHGPEVVNLPQGASVTPAYRVRNESSVTNNTGPTVIIENLNNYHPNDQGRLIRDIGFALELKS